ncbi:MAG: hypothetical protein ACK5LX_04035 [Oscillospiraceae bacterium]
MNQDAILDFKEYTKSRLDERDAWLTNDSDIRAMDAKIEESWKQLEDILRSCGQTKGLSLMNYLDICQTSYRNMLGERSYTLGFGDGLTLRSYLDYQIITAEE